MSRILAIDYGESRTGLAITDPLGFTAQGLETINNQGSHKLRSRFNTIEIDKQDERLTTVEAHKTMNDLNVNKNKKRSIVDTVAAVYILEAYINKPKE